MDGELFATAGIKGQTSSNGGLSKLWSLFGSPKLGPVLGPVL